MSRPKFVAACSGIVVLFIALFYVFTIWLPSLDRPTRGHHRHVRTKALVSDVVNAVKSYQLEYNRLPMDPHIKEDWEIAFDGSAEAKAVLGVLMGEDLSIGSRGFANPREIVFIDPEISNGETLGVVFEGEEAAKLLDAWGQPIRMILDGDYDRKISDPELGSEGEPIRKQVIVWSEGSPADEDEDAPWENNVTMWIRGGR